MFDLQAYGPILLFFLIGAGIGIGPLIIATFVRPHRKDAAKDAPYECGFPEFSDARSPFDVRFYLVAMLFILFDLETAFFVPWSVVIREIGTFGFCTMMFFLAILVVGFIYEWKKGALNWE